MYILWLGHIMCQACVNISSLRGDKCPLWCTNSSIRAVDATSISFSIEADPRLALGEWVAQSVVRIHHAVANGRGDGPMTYGASYAGPNPAK